MSDDRQLIAAWRALLAARMVRKSLVQLLGLSDRQVAHRSCFTK